MPDTSTLIKVKYRYRNNSKNNFVHNSARYHLLPVTLVPVMVHLHGRQGITTLWKGVGSVLVVRGLTLAVEDLISKLTPWPKEISWHSSLKAFGQHLLLKCTTLAFVTPIYSASLVETVQSDIASEKPGIFDVFREGIYRLISWSSPQKGRMLPIWTLLVPTIIHGILKYLLALLAKGVTSRILHLNLHHERRRQGAYPREALEQSTTKEIELTAALVGFYTAEVALYPLETILHRLHLQGTRTIVDNLDTGYEVTPILTSYEGAWDCYETTLTQEGVAGLYRGFGALVFQLASHVTVVRATKFMLTELSGLMASPAKPGAPLQARAPLI
ncbi:mitochondrial outer membrane protein SLC25A46-like isoform X2 [Bacillus rossius redtenbacheri]|uniref:mitochondrial outer membrane protein SLC25A46-like isoform X2 n=1 Tax=Bacillus rossius redtenbacheri TaxID=93214 RepID=UPI002FDD89CB